MYTFGTYLHSLQNVSNRDGNRDGNTEQYEVVASSLAGGPDHFQAQSLIAFSISARFQERALILKAIRPWA